MRHLSRDLRYAWRGLSRSPLFTIVALVSIALGIGANTAIAEPLFIRTLRNLRLLDLGIKAESMIAFNLSPAVAGYTPARIPPFYKTLVERMRAQPSVQAVGFSSMGLLEGNEWDSTVTVEGYQAQQGEQMNPYCNSVSLGYFKTMGIPLLAGREFDARDEGAAPINPPNTPATGDGNGYRHVVINESFAKKYFGDRDRSLLNERFVATLSTAFRVLATLLAVIGLYGVMAYTVARRTREIGVRMALGAAQGDVVWLVMREVLMLVGTGIVLGLVAAWGLGRVVSSQLFGVTATPVRVTQARGCLALYEHNDLRQTSYCRKVRLNLPANSSSGGAVRGMMRDTP